MSEDPTLLTEPPSQCTWGHYLDLLVESHGGWTDLVDVLYHRGRAQVELPDDPQTVERGLRRLASRGNAPGGKYGRWMLRFFGVPEPLKDVARWMGCYHSRFADLPLSIRESQLLLWDRPPVCESAAAGWIHLGVASVAMRKKDYQSARLRLAKAMARMDKSGVEMMVEAKLLSGRLMSESHNADGAVAELEQAFLLVNGMAHTPTRDCYLARIADQRAYLALHPKTGVRDLARAHQLYESIPKDSAASFASFRRSHGLAYCFWKIGRLEFAIEHAELAAEHAADGGFMRFRVMALDLLASIKGLPHDHSLRLRARAMATQLEHEDLLATATIATGADQEAH